MKVGWLQGLLASSLINVHSAELLSVGGCFWREGYPEDKVCPALTVVNRPPGPFQAICPQISHALGGNDPRREQLQETGSLELLDAITEIK